MNKKLLKAELTLAGLFLVALFSVVAFFSLNDTKAWFSSNREVEATGMNVKTESIEEISVNFEMFDFVALEGDKLLFNSTPTTNAKMPDYDLNVPTNIYKLLHITIETEIDNPPNVMLTAKTSTNYFMDRSHKLIAGASGTGGLDENKNSYNNSIISIIDFISLDNTPTSTTYTNEASVTTNCLELKLSGTTSTFVKGDVKNGFSVKGGSIEIVSSDLLTVDPETNKKTVELYVVVLYNRERLSYVFSENIGNPALVDTSTGLTNYGNINFVNDFEFVVTTIN